MNEIASPTENSFSNLIGICLAYTSIQSIPENLFANCPNVTNFYRAFEECRSLESIPANLFANCPNVTNFYCAFEECRSLESIPANLFANCPNVTNFESTFGNCKNITSIPEKLFDNCKKVESFKGTFWGCSMLTGNAPELWKRGTNSEENEYKGNPNGEDCFAVCGGLENWNEIPDYWKSGRPS